MDLLAVYMIKLSNYTVATYIWPTLYNVYSLTGLFTAHQAKACLKYF